MTPRDEAPPLGLVLRPWGPWLLVLVLAAIAAYAHVGLAARVAALEAAARASPAAAAPTVAASPAPPRAVAPPVEPPLDASPVDPAWRCAGTISPGEARAAIGRQGAPVLACIERAATTLPGVRGRLLVRARVADDGAVDALALELPTAAPASDALRGCVDAAARTWRFPPPRGGACAVVEAPFAVGAAP